tara:strand:+ start:91 stop:378 length:288 start_codon:yes stop_codon:yes gene_type:complete
MVHELSHLDDAYWSKISQEISGSLLNGREKRKGGPKAASESKKTGQGIVTLKPPTIPRTMASNEHRESVPNNTRASSTTDSLKPLYIINNDKKNN